MHNSAEAWVKEWAQGRITLKEIEGYTDEELYSVAHIGYFYLMQGKHEDAKTIFEGLIAIDPKNEYYYRALGVIFEHLGDFERALKQFTYAIRLHPVLPHAYVNRAEAYIYLNRWGEAKEDLKTALQLLDPKETLLHQKATALYQSAQAYAGV